MREREREREKERERERVARGREREREREGKEREREREREGKEREREMAERERERERERNGGGVAQWLACCAGDPVKTATVGSSPSPDRVKDCFSESMLVQIRRHPSLLRVHCRHEDRRPC